MSALLALGLCATGLGLHAADAADQNWPQWRGPDGTGVAPSANPPITWSESSNIKWKTKIPGSGSASPIVWGKYVIVETAVPTGKKSASLGSERTPDAPPPPPDRPDGPPRGERPPPPPFGGPPGDRPRRGGGGPGMMGGKPTEAYQFTLVCVDRETGNIAWQKIAREEVPHEGVRDNDGTFASTSPITDGKLIYAWFGSQGLYCYDFDGNLKWKKDLGKMQIKNAFGEGGSPALSGNTLVVKCDHEGGSFIVALDKNDGKELWRKERDEGTSWSTPLIVDQGGKAQVITDASSKIRSYDLATGDLLWECGGLTRNVIPSPVAADGMVYCASGFMGNALLAIRLGKTGDLTGSDAIAWSYNKSMPYVPSPLLYGDKLYCLSGNKGMISSFDAKTGNMLLNTERLEAIPNVYASPVGAGGRVYLAGREGSTVVLKNSEKLEVLATNKLDDKIDASPAVAGNEIYLRGLSYLYCIAEK